MEIAAVAGGLPCEVGQDAGIVGEFAECEGVAECDGAVVRPVGGGIGEDGRWGGDVGMVEDAGFEDGDAVHAPGGRDHFVDEGDFDGADGEELAVEPAAAAEELGAVLAGEEDDVCEMTVARGILGADGFALGCAGAGGFLRVEPVGLEFLFGKHGSVSAVDCATGGGGKRTGSSASG